MKKTMVENKNKKWLGRIFNRLGFVIMAMLVQILALAGMLNYFSSHFALFYAFSVALALVVVVHIINQDSNPAYKIAWIIPLLALPVFGMLFYVAFGKSQLPKRERRRMEQINRQYAAAVKMGNTQGEALMAINADAGLQSAYLEKIAMAPPFGRTETRYCEIGETFLYCLLEELKRAKKFIFLEYFIVAEGKMWNAILSVLEERVQAGVEVRLLYDDFGSMFKLPDDYYRQLEAKGIQCSVFHRFVPVLSGSFNNRDHRKICVIDGNVGFTGGINFADEYINAYDRCGHWLDSAVMLKGEAVWSFTVMFLSMWDFVRHIDEDFLSYRPDSAFCAALQEDGFSQPFTDTPMDNEAVGETAYINMLSRAKRYVYICTPYLIIDNEMMNALCIGAKCGLDIRIVTPCVPDKWYVHATTRSYYLQLLRAGVRIYEYSPGFVHSKTFVSDDLYGICGTINLDYRSLYLHHECAVWMYDTAAVRQMRDNFLQTLKKCQEITEIWCKAQPFHVRLLQRVLRVFAPLM